MTRTTHRLMMVIILGLVIEGLVYVNESSANCSIIIVAVNNGPHPVTLSYHDSKVKIRGGIWKKVFKKNDNLRVLPGAEFTYYYQANLSCSHKRRWSFTLLKGEGCAFEYAWYKPSSTGWFAPGTDLIRLYDLSKKCNN